MELESIWYVASYNHCASTRLETKCHFRCLVARNWLLAHIITCLRSTEAWAIPILLFADFADDSIHEYSGLSSSSNPDKAFREVGVTRLTARDWPWQAPSLKS